MKKSQLGTLMPFMAAALLLVACSPSESSTSEPSKTDPISTPSDDTGSGEQEYVPYFDSPVTIQLWTTAGTTSQTILDNYIKDFKEIEPNVTVVNNKVNGSYAPLQAEEYIDYPRLRDKLDLAERAMKRSDFRLAHDYIDEAKRIAPEDRRVFFLNGKIYDAENRYEEALEEYRNAMLLAPYWAENYYRYGQALVNLGEQQDALFVLERMQYLFPNDKWTGKMEAGYTFVFH